MKKTTRKARLQPVYQKRKYDERAVPGLRLAGVWMEQAGFKCGEHVEISVKKDKLEIKPL